MSKPNVREMLGGRDAAPAPDTRIRTLLSRAGEINGQLANVEDRLLVMLERSVGGSDKNAASKTSGPQSVPNGSFSEAEFLLETTFQWLDKIRAHLKELENIL